MQIYDKSLRPRQLGLIPNWQFIDDPALNPSITGQAMTIAQYNKQYFVPPPGGLGYVMVDPKGSTYMGPANAFNPIASQWNQESLNGAMDVFRAGGWVFDNRGTIALAGGVLLAIGIAGWLIR